MKTSVKTKVKNKKTGEQTIHTAVVKSIETEAVQKVIASPEEAVKEELVQEIQEEQEFNEMMNNWKLVEADDQMTSFLKKKYSVGMLKPFFNHTDSKFPRDASGNTMKVTRFYYSLNLCVDNIPDNWTAEMIQAKKWGIEQAGFQYIWKQNSEVVEVIKGEMVLADKSNFWDRLDALKEKPSFVFDNQPFSFTFGTHIGGLNYATR